MAYTTNFIDLNKPSKVLSLNVTTINGEAYWPHNDGAGDKWWQSGSNAKYFQWEIVATVTAQGHGSHLTRKDFEYNGLDIKVGDWVAGATTGTCVKVVSISAKTSTSVTMIVEDWLRYNTYRSSIGAGIFNTGSAVCFQLNENGHPMLDPVPLAIASADFYLNINSRFQYLNPQMHYVLDQTAHGFSEGDIVSATASGFAKTTVSTATKSIGTVTHPGPGPNQFMLRPNTRIIDFVPAIPGSIGDYIYTDNSVAGGLTTANTSGKVQFIKIADPIATSITGSVVDPTTTSGNKLEINETEVTYTGTVTLAEFITQTNNGTATHNVTASDAAVPTTATTATHSLSWGLVGIYPTAVCTINGTSVTFSTTTAGFAAYGVHVGIAADIVADINAVGPTNIIASVSGSNAVLTNSTGGTITIVNVTGSGSGSIGVAGNPSQTGWPLFTSASTGKYVKLARANGGEILLDDITGNITTNLGIFSVHNGRVPLAIVVEQGIRISSGTVVVADIAARNALTTATGDTAYVIDAGSSEYAFYVYNGSAWVLLADEDSANTDAQTLTKTLFGAAGSGSSSIGKVSATSRVTLITIEVLSVCNGTSVLTIGDAGDNDRLVADSDVDLTTVGVYNITSSHQYSAETEILYYYTNNSTNTGSIKINISYM
jgi:hypothetical protein